MSHFLIRWQFTNASAKALVGKPHDRTGAAKALVEGFGGRLHSYYIAFGEFDGVAICEFPNNTCQIASNSDPLFASNRDPPSSAAPAYRRHGIGGLAPVAQRRRALRGAKGAGGGAPRGSCG